MFTITDLLFWWEGRCVKYFYTRVKYLDVPALFPLENTNFIAPKHPSRPAETLPQPGNEFPVDSRQNPKNMAKAKEGTLLVVDDNRSILSAVQLLMGNYFARVLTLPSPNQLLTTLRCESVDVILLDMNFSAGINTGNEGFYWLQEIHRNYPDIKVVLFTAYADIDLAVRAMRDGAVDFVVKPWDNDRLVAALQGAYNLARSQREVKQLKEIKRELTHEEPMFWGTSPAMMRIREIVEKVAATDANILITGENGTGKEMLAREIHNRSARHRELMVSVDMGALPETLFESELFGHVKGAFTDARADRAGKFEVADRGTLFLDEIGNLPPHLQSKLLTALQSDRIVRVGSTLRSWSTSASSRPRTATSTAWWPKGASAKTCSTASIPSTSTCRRCASAARISSRWPRASCAAMPRSTASRLRGLIRRPSARWRSTPGRATSASCSIPSRKPSSSATEGPSPRRRCCCARLPRRHRPNPASRRSMRWSAR